MSVLNHMGKRLQQLNVHVVICNPFDGLGLKRVLLGQDLSWQIHQMTTFSELRQKIHSPFDVPQVVVVDFCADAPWQVQDLEQILEYGGIPIIGLFRPPATNLGHWLEAGLASYVVWDEDNKYLEDLVSAIKSQVRSVHKCAAHPKLKGNLQKLRSEHNALLNASLTLISYHQKDTRILWSNAVDDEAGGGAAVDYLAGRFPKEIWKQEQLANGKCPIASTVETGESIEAEVTTLDGYAMLQRTYPVKDEVTGELQGVIASTLDISSLSPEQEAIRAAARIQASANLCASVSQKFNSLMGQVMGNVSLALESLGDENPDASQLLRKVESTAYKAGEMSERLLSFSETDEGLFKIVNLGEIVEALLQSQSSYVPEHIQVEHVGEQVLWLIEANSAQINMLLSQLFNNAIDAIERQPEKQGKITIRTANEVVSQSSKLLKPWLDEGRYVVLSIEDTGCGMSAATKSKMFEPFFSTKKGGRGLGLAGAYGIVRCHEGFIFAESTEGEGTRMTIYLPASNVKSLSIQASPFEILDPVKIELPRGTETVMLVNGDTMLRRAMVNLLQGLGYTVIEAKDGPAAIDYATTYDGEIHVAILDMVMSGFEGMETYRKLKGARPGTEIIVMSAYDRKTYEKALLEAGAVAFLQKPIPMDVFAREIRRVLD